MVRMEGDETTTKEKKVERLTVNMKQCNIKINLYPRIGRLTGN
jgi:hypothetical protein